MNVTTGDVREMISLYREGCSQTFIADYIGCDRVTVRNYLIRTGNFKSTRTYHRYPVAMIQHDWNANVSSNQICKIYKIKNVQSLHDRIKDWRKIGWDFKHRNIEKAASGKAQAAINKEA